MDKIKPQYYDRFTCIADACPMTCCREWKIYVDEETEGRWRGMECPAGGPAKGLLSDYVTTREGSRVIKLRKDHDCPHLRAGLCSLVLAYGEQILSRTCHEFPREDHGEELSLMPACPAVVDLIREYGFFLTKDAGDLRDLFLEVLRREDIGPGQALAMIRFLTSQLAETLPEESELGLLPQGGISALFSEAELSSLASGIAELTLDPMDAVIERRELFEDLSAEYQRQKMYPELLGPIQERGDLCDDLSKEKLRAFAKALKPYETLIKDLLAAEIFGTVCCDEPALYLIRLQWIAMEYGLLLHCLLVTFLSGGKLAYEDVRAYAVLVFRMMGYDSDDIIEYMEECFEEPVWEWGYFLLLCSPALV